MYKILVKQSPKVCKKPKNPIQGYFESNFDGWKFYKECNKVVQSENLSIIIEKYEQLLYSIPAKDLKVINDIDVIIHIGDVSDEESDYDQPLEVFPMDNGEHKKPHQPVIVKVLS